MSKPGKLALIDYRLYDDMHGQFDRNFCSVVAFDPGESTGWAVMAATPDRLHGNADVHKDLILYDYGEIDCVSQDYDEWARTNGQHSGLNIGGENRGIEEMVGLCTRIYNLAPIVVEDFIPDMRRMDQARHTLSPVRLMAAFSYGLHKESQNYGGIKGEKRVFIHDRANPKTTCNNERLAHWGLYDSGSGKHSRDATRHCLYFLRNCTGKSPEAARRRHLAWPHLFSDPDDTVYNPNKATRQSRAKKIGDRI